MAGPGAIVGGLRTFRKWMFDVQGFEGGFQLGVISDIDSSRIPLGGSVQLQDFLTDANGKIRKRGGCAYQSSGVTPTGSGANPFFVGVTCPEFNGFDARILGIATNDAAGRTLFDLTDPVTAGPEIALGVQPYENPTVMESNGQIYVICTDGQNHGPVKKITRPGAVGTAVAVGILTASGTKLDGSPTDPIPHGTVSTSLGPYLILANDGAAHQNRVWYGPGGNNIAGNATATSDTPAGWLNQDGSDFLSFWDFSDPIIALQQFQGVTLVWTRRDLYRMMGDRPPGSQDASTKLDNNNIQVQPVTRVGCIDARSVCANHNGVYFANENGVYITDGASTNCITSGQKGAYAGTLYQSFMGDFSVELGHVVALGIYRDVWLMVTVTKFGIVSTTMLCYLPTNAWTVVTNNCNSVMYATSLATDQNQNDIYFCNPFSAAGKARMVKGGGILSPSAGNMLDADGSPIEPLWVSRVLPGGATGLKRFGNARIIYRMHGGTPSLQISMASGMQGENAMVPAREGSPLGVSVPIKRSRFRMYKQAEGLTVQVEQSGASAETEILGIEYEYDGYYQAEEEGN